MLYLRKAEGGIEMSMSEILKFANENPASYLSTVEGDQPRVRAFLMWFADETGFYYHTGAVKDVYKQLKANPKVEICFHDQSSENGKMLRVAGKVEFISDKELKDRLVEERPFLKEVIAEYDEETLQVFRISSGETHFWTMADNLREDQIEKINF